MASRGKIQKQGKAVVPKTLAPQPDYSRQFATSYSNVAVVTHSQHDFCIDFCQVTPPIKADLETESLFVPVVARILIPPTLVEGLIKVLQSQLTKYKDDLAQLPANASDAVDTRINLKGVKE